MSEAPKNTTLDGLHRAVGEAISKWVAVENQMHLIFGICTSMVAMQRGGGFSYDDTIPSAVLDSIDGFNGKLLMIAAALKAALRDLDEEARQLLDDGLAAVASVRTLHGCRNKLAHWTAGRISTNTKTHELKPRLIPRNWRTGGPAVQETDIDEWGENFIAASRSLSAFVERLASHKGLQCRHLELAASQVRCTLPGDARLLEFLKQQLSAHL